MFVLGKHGLDGLVGVGIGDALYQALYLITLVDEASH